MKILKFGADWCPECIIMKPRWAEIEKEMPELNTEFFDIDKNKEKKLEYKIDHVPTFIFLDKEGRELERLKGLIEKEDLIKTIECIIHKA